MSRTLPFKYERTPIAARCTTVVVHIVGVQFHMKVSVERIVEHDAIVPLMFEPRYRTGNTLDTSRVCGITHEHLHDNTKLNVLAQKLCTHSLVRQH